MHCLGISVPVQTAVNRPDFALWQVDMCLQNTWDEKFVYEDWSFTFLDFSFVELTITDTSANKQSTHEWDTVSDNKTRTYFHRGPWCS